MRDPEPWYQQLASAPRRLPLVQAVSVARFLSALPTNRVAVRYYLDELVPRFLSTLERLDTVVIDPDVNTELVSCLEKLTLLGEISGFESDRLRRIVQAPTEVLPTFPAETDLGLGLIVPVVQRLVDDPQSPPTYLGFLAEIRVYPRTSTKDQPLIRLLHGGQSEDVGELETLRCVAEQVRKAAAATGGDPVGPVDRFLPAKRPPHRTFDIAVPMLGAPVAGGSAGLALAGGMLGAMRGFRRLDGLGFRPSRRLAWSGRVSELGNVEPVVRESLPAKIRAAYFAGLDGIVVPWDQIAVAETSVPRTGHPFRVFGVRHIREIPNQDGLCTSWRIPKAIRAVPTPPLSLWERILRSIIVPLVATLGALVLLNSILGGTSHIIDPWSRHWILVIQRGIRPPTILQTNAMIELHQVAGHLTGDLSGEERPHLHSFRRAAEWRRRSRSL
ncbi:MAG: hypothetical protein R3E12_18400 [Candidatus Eisenbacteria bacterium]